MDATICDNTFRSNVAGSSINASGGGLGLYHADATVSGNHIEYNRGTASGEGFGGGFYSEFGLVTIEGNTIVGNVAEFGAVTLQQNDGVTLTNNVVAHNVGGGVLVRGNDSNPFTGTLAHNTIAQNGDQGVYVGWYDSAMPP